MSIYGFATKAVVEPTPIANDTLAPDFTVYTRKTETGTTQLNNKVNPQITDEEWVDIPNRVYVTLASTDGLTVGKLAAHYAHEANHVDAWIKRCDQARDEAQRAIALIGERLIQESNDRNWCSEFDELIDSANGNLPYWLQLPTRVREFNVTWTEQYTITVRRNATFEAKNEEEACDMASDYAEEADDCEMQDAIRYGNYSYDTDNGDYEAEEA